MYNTSKNKSFFAVAFLCLGITFNATGKCTTLVFENIGYCGTSLIGDVIISSIPVQKLYGFFKDLTYDYPQAMSYSERWDEEKDHVIFDADSLDLDLVLELIAESADQLPYLSKELFYGYDFRDPQKSAPAGSLQIRGYDASGKLIQHYMCYGLAATRNWMNYLAEKSAAIPSLKTWELDGFLMALPDMNSGCLPETDEDE